MDLLGIVQGIEASALGEWMRGSLKALPVVNALHVIALAVVFGTIFIVDLRLLGYPGKARAFTRVSDEVLRWTWAAFALAVVTGALMFAANATTYYNNTPFRLKMLVLVLAGINMAVFQFITVRSVPRWNVDVTPPWAARIAGLLSISLWTVVIFLGRWVGFTKGYNFEVPEELEENLFDFGMRLIDLGSGLA
jgi:hypothetical protein